MAHSKASSVRITAAQRRGKALDLRKQGQTYAQIAAALGVSESRAHQVVTEELRRLHAERSEAAGEVLRLELERLDVLQASVWPKAKAGEPTAVERVLNIMARRAKLLGLDAPTKVAATDPAGNKAATFRVAAAELDDDTLATIASGGSPGAAGPPAGP
jgi:hypothetical protein